MVKISFNKTKQTKKDTFFYLILALLPILSLYHFIPGLNLGYALALIVICIKVIKNRFRVPINFKISMLMGIFLGINLIVGATKYSDFTSTLNNSLGMVVFTVLVILICNPKTLNIDRLYTACKIVGVISTVFLLYQFTAYYAFDLVVKGNIPFLYLNDIGFRSIEYGRPTSFFLEPAHYSLYISPIYAMSIIKKEYVVSLFFLLGLIFSTATTGVVMAVILPIIIVLNYKNRSSFKNIIIIIFAIVLIQFVTAVFFESILTKISVDNLESNIRVFGTLYIFDYFEPNEWLFGIGINRMPDFLGAYLDTIIGNYANSLFFSIISFGLIGGSAFMIYLYSLYKKTPVKYKVMWVVLILCLMSDQILFNRNLLYLLIWQYATFELNIRKEEISVFSKEEVQYEGTASNYYNTCV